MPSKREQASFFCRNGFTLVFGALMLLTLVRHALTGWRVENQEPMLSDLRKLYDTGERAEIDAQYKAWKRANGF